MGGVWALEGDWCICSAVSGLTCHMSVRVVDLIGPGRWVAGKGKGYTARRGAER
jgi:hypothetical protein